MHIINDAQTMNSNLHRRLTRGETFAIGLAFGMAGIFLWLSPNLSYFSHDFTNYLNTARGDFGNYYYGYWILPVFALLAKLPVAVSYLLWCTISILGIFFAARVFGGKATLALASFQMFYSLIYGQVTGLIVGGLALCWWGIVNRKWYIAGIGIALASAKYQLGIPGILFLLLLAKISWKDWARLLVIPVVVWGASLVVYPGWPLQAYSILAGHAPNANGSISLWRWVGPWAFLLLIPPLILHLPAERRFMALVAAVGLVLPYFQQADLLFLLTLPIGWIGLLGNLGYLLPAFGWPALQLLAILPLTIYLCALYPALKDWGLHHPVRTLFNSEKTN